jgi:hypothetical protein
MSAPSLVRDPYFRLELNARNIVMSTAAPYNTLQLSVTPYTASGAVFTTDVQPTFWTNSTAFTVSPAGLVTATKVSASSFVVATLQDTVHNITHVDTAFITITGTTPASPLASLSIQRPPDDSAKIGVYGSSKPLDTLKVVLTAENGSDLSAAVPVRFSISDPSVVKFTTIAGHASWRGINSMRVGHVTLSATTTYYGVTKTDSLEYTIGNPVLATVGIPMMPSPTVAGEVIRAYSPSVIVIGVGGTVIFAPPTILTGTAVDWDVVFDDPDAAQPSTLVPTSVPTGAGNIGPNPPFATNGAINPACAGAVGASCRQAARAFMQPGTYTYHSALYGTTGKIIVRAP